MPLVDLSKIIIHKTVIGINCPRCGGDLKPLAKPLFLGRLLYVFFLTGLKPKSYQCAACKKKCLVL